MLLSLWRSVITMAEATEVRTAVPMLATKLRRPSTPLLRIARPRLLEQLTTNADRRLILVSAPAGYGKTALISHWLDAAAGANAWLSLDEQDNELATFLLYLVAAIRGAYPDAMAAVEQQLGAPTLLPPIRLADAVLEGMAAFPGPLMLALDDYHVIKAADVHALMARLIEHLPPHVHLVVITRADPPLPLDRLRGRQQLGEIRGADLCFNTEETRLLLQQMLGPDVSEETVALLEEGTEGWAVGLHLAGLSLRNRSDPAVFARKIAEHGHQAVTEYLLSEVLACLPQAQADCLLQTSLFDRFCASLIDAAQAEDGVKLSGDDFLRAIRRGNLFVVSLDDEGTWSRYHHFFQALLRARLGLRYANAEIKAMHARAAVWFSAQGLVDEAIMHFLEAGDPIAAASLVEAQVHPALDRENWRQIERWMGLLPADVSSRRPRLLLAQAWLYYIRWQFGGIEARLDAAEGVMREFPAAAGGAETTLWGEISVLRSTLAQNKGDGKLVAQLSEAGIAALRPQTGYTIGVAHFNYIWALQECGQYERAVEFARRQLDASGWQPHALNLRVLLALANIHHEMADLPALQDIVPTWQKLARQGGLGLSVAWSQFAEGWLSYQRNELEAADEAFRRLVDVAWAAHGRAVVDGYTGLVLTALGRGRPDEVAAHANALNERLLERGMLALVSVARSLEQRVALAVGSPSALDWRPDPSSAAVPVDLWEQPVLTYVRTLLAVGSPSALAQATELLADSRARALARNSGRRLIEAGALQALVLAAQGHEAAALAALQEAVERAAPGGSLRLLADCGPGLIPLLRKLQAAGVAPRYIEKVLAAVGEAATVPATSAAQPAAAPIVGQATAAETLTNRQMDILILLAERLSDKEIAERLVLEPVTVKKHVQRLYRRLGVNNRRAAVAQARRLGLI
jgi:LuxR family maltose regulon positive regulatory protein